MNRWTYYSPIFLGAAFAVLAKDLYDDQLPLAGDWRYWTALSAVAVAFGLIGQAAMIGIQGAFAQVLPVPGGRSIRGRGAVVAGGLLLLSVGGSVVTGLLSWEALVLPVWVAGIVSTAALVAALITYAWCWPAAQHDFAGGRFE